MKSPANFAHRRNAEGTCDAICLDCFQTIAISSTEEELAKAENHHVCLRKPRENRGRDFRDGNLNQKESAFDVRG
jgi:hypothetical protein